MFYIKKPHSLYYLAIFISITFASSLIESVFASEDSFFAPIIKKRPNFGEKKQGSSKVKEAKKKDRSLLGVFTDRLMKQKTGQDFYKKKSIDQKWQWPTRAKILEKFSKKTKGLLLLVSGKTCIYPLSEGIVVYVGSILMDYGKMVVILHKNQYMSIYGHLTQIFVKEGDLVSLGTEIGRVGAVETSTFFELYVGVRGGGEFLDLEVFLQ